MVNSTDIDIGRQRLLQVFRFLQAFNERKNPPKRQIREQEPVLWLRDLPEHDCVQLTSDAFDDTNITNEDTEHDAPSVGDDYLLRVRRPTLRPPPDPPEELVRWLADSWNNPDRPLQVREALDADEEGGLPETFGADPGRQQLLERWAQAREQWAKSERPARAAMRIFERFYEVHATTERESEQVELVLGDGILNWRRPDGGIHHPILLQRVQVEFDPNVPEFYIRESDFPVELYTSLFRSIAEVDGHTIAVLQKELEAGGYHPLGGQRTSAWLRGAVQQLSRKGVYVGSEEPSGEGDHPRMGRQPVFFLRRRSLGFARAIEAIIEDLPTRDDIPASLLRVVGVDTSPDGDIDAAEETPEFHEDDILLTKPANPEQLDTARSLEKHQAVLVQGPPGTGKTHTIANLIGYLLAQGKRVLVTSHTTKALRVLRDQVEPELQPLCVSVLDTDIESRDQLEHSIRGTVERLSDKDNIEQFRRQDRSLSTERSRLLRELRETREQLLYARDGEYREIIVDGTIYTPSNAARLVAETRERDGWIPSPVLRGEPMPLSRTEVLDLYRTNAAVSPEDERELDSTLPDPSELLTPSDFSYAVESLARSTSEQPSNGDLWRQNLAHQDANTLNSLMERAVAAVRPLDTSDTWRLAAMDAGLRSEGPLWDDLLLMIENLIQQRSEGQKASLEYDLQLAPERPLAEQEQVLVEINNMVRPGRRVGGFALMRHRRWRRVLQSMSINGEPPREAEHLDALLQRVRLEIGRQALRERWARQLEPLGAPSLHGAPEPEHMASDYIPGIRIALDWAQTVYRPLEDDLQGRGLGLAQLKALAPPNRGHAFDVLSLRSFILDFVQPEVRRRYWETVSEQAIASLKRVSDHLSSLAASEIAASLLAAIAALDADAYGQIYGRLVATRERGRDLALRRHLLGRLDRVAPAWAAAINERIPLHDSGEPPADPEAAWLWRQLRDELEMRGAESLDALQSKISDLSLRLERTTAELVEMRAWTRQIQRTSHEQRQALVGFSDLVRRIGRGTGKRAPRLRVEAQRQLGRARDSVPVWIMPLSRVVDSFDPRSKSFDVVIVDEASQSDTLALIALYLGKRVVVVGDHEQVTPAAVGERIADVDQMIDTHLQGIPNALLYDGQMSIYDLARQAFGRAIRLTEHFRCAPDIISFSNGLSYNGEIKPLRDPGGISLKRHVVEHPVRGSENDDNVNQMESEAVASLVASAIEQPEYEGKSIGVISLLGTEQARAIETLLLRHVSPVEFERRRILCGNPAHFQGDERDVMFLSMVHGPREGGPLRRLGDPGERFKKRYNVAASRAKDQMWLVHSLDPNRDLQPGDLRKRLIDHVRDPHAREENIEKERKRAESPFEERVLERLITAGYDVESQYKAGYYRIDIIVRGQQIAIECDGDRYHTEDNLKEDMERQTVLERLGWRFIRLRGTKFYRDPDGTMANVFERLRELGAQPRSRTPEPTSLEPNDLIERVKRRAAEIRAAWSGSAAEAGMERGETVAAEEPGLEPVEDVGEVSGSVGEAVALFEQETQPAEQPRAAAILRAARQHSPANGTSDGARDQGTSPADRGIAYARERGLRVEDRRSIGGALWIIGGEEHEAPLRMLGFAFVRNGGRASGHLPAWYRPADA